MGRGKRNTATESLSRYRKLVEVCNIVNSTLEIGVALDLVIETVTTALDAEACSLLLIEPDADILYFKSVTGTGSEEVKKFRLKLGEGIAGIVAKDGVPLLVSNAREDARVRHDIAREAGLEVKSILCTPLIVGNKRVGSVEVMNPRRKKAFDEEDLGFLSAISDSVAIGIRNARLYSQLSTQKEGLTSALGLKRIVVGTSEVMRDIFSLVTKLMGTDVTVLMTGETGTGKGLLARFIHENSQRKNELFVDVNCAAIPETLIESELFGHEKGAFTGATYQRKGKFELADNGTLFLDEVGDLSTQAQAKLLRSIEEQRFERVGSNVTLTTDVRIIATTNKKLWEEVKRNRFRDDLYYRLNQMPIHIPPLRERKEDILLLVNHFISDLNQQLRKDVKGVSDRAAQFLMQYDWPGNVRELRNVIKRAMVLAESDIISLEHLPFLTDRNVENSVSVRARFPSLEETERDHIRRAMDAAGGVKKKAAALLGISRSTLDRKIQAYGL